MPPKITRISSDTFRVEGGTVVWPHEQDICPDTLYEDSERLVSKP